jgi:hypothetical protein
VYIFGTQQRDKSRGLSENAEEIKIKYFILYKNRREGGNLLWTSKKESRVLNMGRTELHIILKLIKNTMLKTEMHKCHYVLTKQCILTNNFYDEDTRANKKRGKVSPCLIN